MKAHLAKVSLALLSTAFLLGCQEQGSNPVGPEGLGPEFTHKNGEHGKGGRGGGGGKTDLAVTYTTHADTVFASPTFTTKRLIGEGCELDPPLELAGYVWVLCAQGQRVRGGKLTEIHVWVTETGDSVWHSGWLPVDPPVTLFAGLTLHLHADNVALSKEHDKKAPSPGTISVVDLVYTAR